MDAEASQAIRSSHAVREATIEMTQMRRQRRRSRCQSKHQFDLDEPILLKPHAPPPASHDSLPLDWHLPPLMKIQLTLMSTTRRLMKMTLKAMAHPTSHMPAPMKEPMQPTSPAG